MLPAPVMAQAQAEWLDYQSSGVSVMELSHRSDTFQSILDSAQRRLRELLVIPDNYQVLFMQGGASQQFSCVPLNLLHNGLPARYLHSGYWAEKAIAEARKFADVDVVPVVTGHPKALDLRALNDASGHYSYVHYTPNETIDGLAFTEIPEIGDAPLVADMSSCILSQPLDISQFGLIYAGAQKNIGPAGLVVVIVREDLLTRANPESLPRLLHYQTIAGAQSMANTPPTLAIYLADLVFQWLQQQGGLASIARLNQQKASLLYDALDHSNLYHNDVAAAARSRMNVPFFLTNGMDRVFVAEAAKEGLLNLLGHRSVGGCRASIYNSMPLAGVHQLIDFMNRFESHYV